MNATRMADNEVEVCCETKTADCKRSDVMIIEIIADHQSLVNNSNNDMDVVVSGMDEDTAVDEKPVIAFKLDDDEEVEANDNSCTENGFANDSANDIETTVADMFPEDTVVVTVKGANSKLVYELKLPARNKEEFEDWLGRYCKRSSFKYLAKRTQLRSGRKVAFRAVYRCERNTVVRKSTKKNAGCDASMEVTIKQSDDLDQYPSTVIVNHWHNHDLSATVKAKPNLRKQSRLKPATVESPDEEDEEVDEMEGADEELASAAYSILPTNTVLMSVRGTANSFICEAKVPIKSKEEFVNWLKNHSQLSSVTYRLRNTIKSLGKKVIYKAVYRCQHNTLPRRNSKPSKKHTGCGATLAVVIRKALNENSVKGIKISQYPTLIKLHHTHNHRIKEDVALKHRDPSDEVKDKLLNIFKDSANPAQALHILTANLTEEYDDDVEQILSDRSKCPDINWIYRLYYANYAELSGLNDFETMVENLKIAVNRFDEKHGGNTTKLAIVNEKDVVVTVSTPLMRRCHSLSTAADVVFVDSSGNMEKFNCKVFILMINSCVGGLPIGVMFSTSEKEAVLTSALQLYLELVPAENAFGGRGKAGPEMFLIEDNVAEQNSIAHCFPQSKVMLCAYHLLQAAWRWVWDGKDKFKPEDRKQLFRLLANMISCKSAFELEEVYASVCVNETARSYEIFLKYAEALHQKKHMWIPFSPQNSNNETVQSSSIHVLKDKVFKRTKSLNLVQLFDFVTEGLTDYYAMKLLRTIGRGMDNYVPSKYMAEYSIEDLEVVKVAETEFVVTQKNGDKEYVVCLDIGACNCPLGLKSVPCKHQCAVVHRFKIQSQQWEMDSLDSDSRKMLYHIATGDWVIYDSWNISWTSGVDNASVRDHSAAPGICEWNPTNPELLLAKKSESDVVPQSFREIWEQCGRLILPFYKNNPSAISQQLNAFCKQLRSVKNESSVISMFRVSNKS